MSIRMPNSVIKYASTEEQQSVYRLFYDYFMHWRAVNEKGKEHLEYKKFDKDGNPISLEQKEELMNASLKREIMRVAGITDMGTFPLATWSTHPTLSWAMFAVVGAMIDLILPDTIIDSIGLYTDIVNIGFGDSAAFDVEPRDLFVVSRHGGRQRTSEIHKQFRGQRTVIPENRELTVQVGLYKVLAGQESLAFFVMKVVRSMETAVTLDAYNAFTTLMNALDNTATTGLRTAGYTQDELMRLCENVTAWNQGSKAVIVGTSRALLNVLPNDANYRYMLDSDYVKMGYIRTAFGYDVLSIPQVADQTTPWGSVIATNRIWILSPASQKLIKLVFEGTTLSNTSSTFDMANLTQNSTLHKRWGTVVATNAVAGVITL